MIDIHTHILWDFDDGADTIEDTLAMLQAAAQAGTTDIVATPHLNAEYGHRPEMAAERIQELNARNGGRPNIHSGCEFHLSIDNLDQLMADPQAYTINGKQYLLLECPDHHVGKHAEGILRQLLDNGIVPVIAHPERNPVLERDPARLESWVEMGCLAQLTALSVVGGFGRAKASTSARLLDRGLVHVVASDAHDPQFRHACMDGARMVIESRHGTEAADMLFTENPRCIIEGSPLTGGRLTFMEPPGRWWHFWKSKSD
jgi:protein-tyrosine phosphatase